TDKTTVEIPSPAAGRVARILVAEGETVPVGTVLVVIGEDGAAPGGEEQSHEAPSKAAAPAPGGRVRATPLVRSLAKELGVDLDPYDLGVAVETDQGLVVPVVRDCDSRSLEELAEDVARLAQSAREHALRPEELRGSTFTVTSAGKLGGLLTTPIVNHPEV